MTPPWPRSGLLNLHLRAGTERARRIEDDDFADLQAARHLNGVGGFDANRRRRAVRPCRRRRRTSAPSIGSEPSRTSAAGGTVRRLGHIAHLDLGAREESRDELRLAGHADDDLERAAARVDQRRDAIHFAFGREARQRIDRDRDRCRRPSALPKSSDPTDGAELEHRVVDDRVDRRARIHHRPGVGVPLRHPAAERRGDLRRGRAAARQSPARFAPARATRRQPAPRPAPTGGPCR